MPMTNASKGLVVITSVACFTFLGVVGMTSVGGPNWEAEARKLQEYSFEKSDGEPVTWTAVEVVTGQSVGQATPVLAEAIINARKHLKQRHLEEIGEITEQIPEAQARRDEATELIEAGLKGIQDRDTALNAELDELEAQIAELAGEGIRKSQEAQAKRAVAELRREEVLRLKAQLAEIRTDKFWALEQIKQLRNALIQIQGNIDRMKRREQQLIEVGIPAE
jgi:DNA repair exonuclease SbcCD ATPase subunit